MGILARIKSKIVEANKVSSSNTDINTCVVVVVELKCL